MPKQSVTVTDSFHAQVQQYADDHGISSWSSALVELAAVGLKIDPARAKKSWGGDRRTYAPGDEPNGYALHREMGWHGAMKADGIGTASEMIGKAWKLSCLWYVVRLSDGVRIAENGAEPDRVRAAMLADTL